jgi:hypothetical protein
VLFIQLLWVPAELVGLPVLVDQIHLLLILLPSAAVEEQLHQAQVHLVDRVAVEDIHLVQAELAQQVKVIMAVLVDPVARNLLRAAVVAPEQ